MMLESLRDEYVSGRTVSCGHASAEYAQRTARITDRACTEIERDPSIGGLWRAVAVVKGATAPGRTDYCGECIAQELTAIDACAWAHGVSQRARSHVLGKTADVLAKRSDLDRWWEPMSKIPALLRETASTP
jgi:hypothetical protein